MNTFEKRLKHGKHGSPLFQSIVSGNNAAKALGQNPENLFSVLQHYKLFCTKIQLETRTTTPAHLQRILFKGKSFIKAAQRAFPHLYIQKVTGCNTWTNLKMAKAGALSSEYRNPKMLSSWVLKQLSPRPNRKLQNMATSLLREKCNQM